MRLFVLLLAGGTGQRLDPTRAKQEMDLGGRPLFDWSVRLFASMPEVYRIILVSHPDSLASMRRRLAGLELLSLVPGGATRHQSALCGLAALSGLAPEDSDYLLVHDVARPFVRASLVRQLCRALEGPAPGNATDTTAAAAAAAPYVPVSSSLVRLSPPLGHSSPRVEAFEDRARYGALQTPQAMRWGVLRRLLLENRENRENRESRSQNAKEAAGRPSRPFYCDLSYWSWLDPTLSVRLVVGDELNFKITTPLDLQLARLVASNWRAEPEEPPPTPQNRSQ